MKLGTAILRYLRRTRVGGPIEYLAQLLDGLIDHKLLRSGAGDDEKRRRMSGDDLVPHPMWEATRAVTIEAPMSKVWPWVAQRVWSIGVFAQTETAPAVIWFDAISLTTLVLVIIRVRGRTHVTPG